MHRLLDDLAALFDLDRIRPYLKSEIDTPRSLTSGLYGAIADYQDMDKLEDDVTFVAARTNPRAPG